MCPAARFARLAGLLAWLTVCLVGQPPCALASAEAGQQAKSIYGQDDRLEEYEVADPALLALGDATVALVDTAFLQDNRDGTYTLLGNTVGYDYDLCPAEPFRDQPAVAFCTGFLAAPDLVVTAGHCVVDDYEAGITAVVFGFVMQDAYEPAVRVPASEVYFVKRLYARHEPDPDWCVVQLDRPADGHTPVACRTGGKVPDGEPLLMIGYPLGMPRKYAGGSAVQDNRRANSFFANLDAFIGNSGSPVFSARTYRVEGILINGAADFVQRFGYSCQSSARYRDDQAAETITRSTLLADVLATASNPDPDHVIEPRVLDFGAGRDTMSVRVHTESRTPWSFTVTAQQPWISVEPAGGASSGSNDPRTIAVTVDRSELAPGWHTGRITVDDTSVAVLVDATGIKVGRILCGPLGAEFAVGLVAVYALLGAWGPGGWDRRRARGPTA